MINKIKQVTTNNTIPNVDFNNFIHKDLQCLTSKDSGSPIIIEPKSQNNQSKSEESIHLYTHNLLYSSKDIRLPENSLSFFNSKLQTPCFSNKKTTKTENPTRHISKPIQPRPKPVQTKKNPKSYPKSSNPADALISQIVTNNPLSGEFSNQIMDSAKHLDDINESHPFDKYSMFIDLLFGQSSTDRKTGLTPELKMKLIKDQNNESLSGFNDRSEQYSITPMIQKYRKETKQRNHNNNQPVYITENNPKYAYDTSSSSVQFTYDENELNVNNSDDSYNEIEAIESTNFNEISNKNESIQQITIASNEEETHLTNHNLNESTYNETINTNLSLSKNNEIRKDNESIDSITQESYNMNALNSNENQDKYESIELYEKEIKKAVNSLKTLQENRSMNLDLQSLNESNSLRSSSTNNLISPNQSQKDSINKVVFNFNDKSKQTLPIKDINQISDTSNETKNKSNPQIDVKSAILPKSKSRLVTSSCKIAKPRLGSSLQNPQSTIDMKQLNGKSVIRSNTNFSTVKLPNLRQNSQAKSIVSNKRHLEPMNQQQIEPNFDCFTEKVEHICSLLQKNCTKDEYEQFKRSSEMITKRVALRPKPHQIQVKSTVSSDFNLLNESLKNLKQALNDRIDLIIEKYQVKHNNHEAIDNLIKLFSDFPQYSNLLFENIDFSINKHEVTSNNYKKIEIKSEQCDENQTDLLNDLDQIDFEQVMDFLPSIISEQEIDEIMKNQNIF